LSPSCDTPASIAAPALPCSSQRPYFLLAIGAVTLIRKLSFTRQIYAHMHAHRCDEVQRHDSWCEAQKCSAKCMCGPLRRSPELARALQLVQRAGWLRAEAQLHHMAASYPEAIACLLQDSRCAVPSRAPPKLLLQRHC